MDWNKLIERFPAALVAVGEYLTSYGDPAEFAVSEMTDVEAFVAHAKTRSAHSGVVAFNDEIELGYSPCSKIEVVQIEAGFTTEGVVAFVIMDLSGSKPALVLHAKPAAA